MCIEIKFRFNTEQTPGSVKALGFQLLVGCSGRPSHWVMGFALTFPRLGFTDAR